MKDFGRARRGCQIALGQGQHETRIPHRTVLLYQPPLSSSQLMTVLCRYYKFRGVAYPDLVQEGTFGLIKAVDKYDPDRGWYKIIDSTSTIEYTNSQRLLGFRFSTYASWWIKQSVSRSIAEKSRIIRLPVHIHDMMVSLRLK